MVEKAAQDKSELITDTPGVYWPSVYSRVRGGRGSPNRMRGTSISKAARAPVWLPLAREPLENVPILEVGSLDGNLIL